METRYSKQLHTPSSLNLKQWHEYKTRMGVLGSGDRALCARCMRMPSGGAPAAVGVDLVQRAGKQPSSSHAGSRPGRASRASPAGLNSGRKRPGSCLALGDDACSSIEAHPTWVEMKPRYFRTVISVSICQSHAE